MDSNWKQSFVEKLNRAQSQWTSKFTEVMESQVSETFEDIRRFVQDNGFAASTPLREDSRRSFKFELAENAYLLMIFRSVGVGEFEVRSESFVPGRDAKLAKMRCRLVDVDEAWARDQFQAALDAFVAHLADETAGAPEVNEELVLV
ncbi:hypothetical protein RAS1_28400 [Phycisphaerae bacterium RAS1]|nr:hypothetical protein RAS1_28400 [Phycisphaerae bacterium RAS1]